MLTESQVAESFDASVIHRIYEAADQDGYDGGFVRVDDDGETWAVEIERLKNDETTQNR